MSSFTNTEEYQQKVRDEYWKRNPKIQVAKVSSLLAALGFSGMRSDDIEQITSGNVNATFSCRDHGRSYIQAYKAIAHPVFF